jgi:hypothetical protein
MSTPHRDANQTAFAVVQQATGQTEPAPEKDPAAVARGRKGGTMRASRMTPEQRSADARAAVNARWAKARAATA